MLNEGAAPIPAVVARQIIESDLTETSANDAARVAVGRRYDGDDMELGNKRGGRIRWQRGRCLGKGAFAEVYQGVDIGEMLQYTSVICIHTRSHTPSAHAKVRRTTDTFGSLGTIARLLQLGTIARLLQAAGV